MEEQGAIQVLVALWWVVGNPRGTAVALLVQLQGHSRQPQCSQLHIRYYIIDYFLQSCATSRILSLSLYYSKQSEVPTLHVHVGELN